MLSEHDRAQERLYRMWAAGWIRDQNIVRWAQSLERLQREGDCDYLVWLLQRFPQLYKSDAASEGPVRRTGDARAGEALPGGEEAWDSGEPQSSE